MVQPIFMLPGDALTLGFDLKDEDDPEAQVFGQEDTPYVEISVYDISERVNATHEGNTVTVTIPGTVTAEIGSCKSNSAYICLHWEDALGERHTVIFGADKTKGDPGQPWLPVVIQRCHPEGEAV